MSLALVMLCDNGHEERLELPAAWTTAEALQLCTIMAGQIAGLEDVLRDHPVNRLLLGHCLVCYARAGCTVDGTDEGEDEDDEGRSAGAEGAESAGAAADAGEHDSGA